MKVGAQKPCMKTRSASGDRQKGHMINPELERGTYLWNLGGWYLQPPTEASSLSKGPEGLCPLLWLASLECW